MNRASCSTNQRSLGQCFKQAREDCVVALIYIILQLSRMHVRRYVCVYLRPDTQLVASINNCAILKLCTSTCDTWRLDRHYALRCVFITNCLEVIIRCSGELGSHIFLGFTGFFSADCGEFLLRVLSRQSLLSKMKHFCFNPTVLLKISPR